MEETGHPHALFFRGKADRDAEMLRAIKEEFLERYRAVPPSSLGTRPVRLGMVAVARMAARSSAVSGCACPAHAVMGGRIVGARVTVGGAPIAARMARTVEAAAPSAVRSAR